MSLGLSFKILIVVFLSELVKPYRQVLFNGVLSHGMTQIHGAGWELLLLFTFDLSGHRVTSGTKITQKAFSRNRATGQQIWSPKNSISVNSWRIRLLSSGHTEALKPLSSQLTREGCSLQPRHLVCCTADLNTARLLHCCTKPFMQSPWHLRSPTLAKAFKLRHLRTQPWLVCFPLSQRGLPSISTTASPRRTD